MSLALIKSIRQEAKYLFTERLRFACANAWAKIANKGRAPIRVLLLDDQRVYTSEQQYAPLLAQRATLQRELGVVLCYQRTDDILPKAKSRLAGYDVVGLKLSHLTPADEALRITRTVRDAMPADASLIYFDGDDDLCVLWPEVAEVADAYVKKHLFLDRAEYKKSRIGKTNLTDYVAKTSGFDFSTNVIPESPPLDDAQIKKLVLGWNIGLDDKIFDLRASYPEPPTDDDKDIDVVCRASVPDHSWIFSLRAPVIAQIESLSSRHKVLTPDHKVSQETYNQEMLRSRICVSPFGYGEICWRDFEAILCGCVLVKPEMSHVETAPDVFIPNETYVPIRWDCQDLGDRLTELLEQPEERQRLRDRARAQLCAYMDGPHLTQRFQEILEFARTRHRDT